MACWPIPFERPSSSRLVSRPGCGGALPVHLPGLARSSRYPVVMPRVCCHLVRGSRRNGGSPPPSTGSSQATLSTRQHAIDQRLGFRLDALQVRLAFEAFGVDLVDVLGAGWPRGEPAVIGDHLQSANRCAIARRLGENLGDGLTSQYRCRDLRGRRFAQFGFLLAISRRIDALVHRRAEALGQCPIALPRVMAGDGGYLRRQQAEDDAVLVGRPGAAVLAQERSPSRLLATEAKAAVHQAVEDRKSV